jgi:hypothetical protein
MSKSVSNDALWERLSEIEEKINKSLMEQNKLVPTQQQVDVKSELKAIKEEIIEIFKKCIQGLGTHCDVHFKSILTKTSKLDSDMVDAIVYLVHLIKESEKQQKPKDTQSYFSFKFFKIRKTSLMITILGLLVFILTLFSMKQQNDYSLLMDEYYRQGFELREMQNEIDSLSTMMENTAKKK